MHNTKYDTILDYCVAVADVPTFNAAVRVALDERTDSIVIGSGGQLISTRDRSDRAARKYRCTLKLTHDEAGRLKAQLSKARLASGTFVLEYHSHDIAAADQAALLVRAKAKRREVSEP